MKTLGSKASGTTGPACSDVDRAKVEKAALWLAEQTGDSPRPIIPALMSMFELSRLQACEAAAMANKFRVFRGVLA